MFYTNDPVADAERHQAELERERKKRPRCSECKEHIIEDVCFEFDGELFCINCLENKHRRWVEDYVS